MTFLKCKFPAQSLIAFICYPAVFFFSDFFRNRATPFVLEWERVGSSVRVKESRVGFSTVSVNLPTITSETERQKFTTFKLQWQGDGAGEWQSLTVPIDSTSVDLPGELADGTYKVRIRATGPGDVSPFTAPFYVTLVGRGMSQWHRLAFAIFVCQLYSAFCI